MSRILTLFGIALVCGSAYGSSIPLEESAWLSLSFSKTVPNRVVFEKKTMRIEVRKSAGPVVHRLPQARAVSGFEVKGHFSGVKNIEKSEFDEDSILRVGLVAEGKQTLSGPRAWFAADWVKKLFSLAPAGAGIDKIYFFVTTNRAELLGRRRPHPTSDLIVEEIVFNANAKGEGDLDFKHQLKEPIRTVGLWLSVDGDDTQSTFSTTLSSLELKP